MRVRIRRLKYQRNARVLLAFALLIPAAGFLTVAGPNTVSLTAVSSLVLLAFVSLYDALRVAVVVNRYGIGIAGALFSPMRWFAWSEIVQVETDAPIVALTTRSRELFQVHVDTRAARFITAMVGRTIMTHPPL
jgi:hypothetical protein